MTDKSNLPPERLIDLLADRALFGLSNQEQAELAALLQDNPAADTSSFDETAAHAHLSVLPEEMTLPVSLQQRLVEQGQAELADNAAAAKGLPRELAASTLAPPAPQLRREWLAWLTAAASVAAALFFATQDPVPQVVEISPAELRSQLLRAEDAVTQASWTDPADESQADLGDIVWSHAQQQGVMRFRGLPANDPKKTQYQLWIFDANQDERYPIDGGVFDVPAGEAETLVAIDPKLKVSAATLFAITIEKPGGVVVSSRERLPLLAKVAL